METGGGMMMQQPGTTGIDPDVVATFATTAHIFFYSQDANEKKQAEAYFHGLKKNTDLGFPIFVAVCRQLPYHQPASSSSAGGGIEHVLAAQLLSQICKKTLDMRNEHVSVVADLTAVCTNVLGDIANKVLAQLVLAFAALVLRLYIVTKLSRGSGAETIIFQAVQSVCLLIPARSDIGTKIVGAIAELCISKDFASMVPSGVLGPNHAKINVPATVLAGIVEDNLGLALQLCCNNLVTSGNANGSSNGPGDAVAAIISTDNFANIAAVSNWMQLCAGLWDEPAVPDMSFTQTLCLLWAQSPALIFAHKFIRSYAESCWAIRQSMQQQQQQHASAVHEQSIGVLRDCFENCSEIVIGQCALAVRFLKLALVGGCDERVMGLVSEGFTLSLSEVTGMLELSASFLQPFLTEVSSVFSQQMSGYLLSHQVQRATTDRFDFEACVTTKFDDIWKLISRLFQYAREFGETLVPCCQLVNGSRTHLDHGKSIWITSIAMFSSKFAVIVNSFVQECKVIAANTVSSVVLSSGNGGSIPSQDAVGEYLKYLKIFMVESVDSSFNYFIELFKAMSEVTRTGNIENPEAATKVFAAVDTLIAASIVASEESISIQQQAGGVSMPDELAEFRKSLRDTMRELCNIDKGVLYTLLRDTMARISELQQQPVVQQAMHGNIVELESRLHLISALTKTIKEMIAASSFAAGWQTAMTQFLGVLSALGADECLSIIRYRSLARMIVVIVGDLLPSICNLQLIQRLAQAVAIGKNNTMMSADTDDWRLSLPALYINCFLALLACSYDHAEVVNGPTTSVHGDLLPFRVKQDHIGIVSVLKGTESLQYFSAIQSSGFVGGDNLSANTNLLPTVCAAIREFHGAGSGTEGDSASILKALLTIPVDGTQGETSKIAQSLV
jgi:uncharacterized protein YaaW (UPF0174 family)